ncbi:sugar phosphate isomerase/epimerase family protein [Sporosalibacterium faouarense]|uniref:sugar phosphate isomerase/epimerase family protein n=1 Tax=Sporosalibacterium faouarense TaxID=516123 RepID=UPI00141C865F|nr:TIM barrel protein [Sporosalibacterium faouarense]MTI49243.1 TIM barrel protein [Bacillota bacterium]
MHNFLIGMHGGFDYEKFNRDFKEGFFGIEACMFPNEKEVGVLVEEAKKHKFKMGIHFSLFQGSYRLRDPLFLSLDSNEVEKSYKAFKSELKYASEIGADYILVHFPKPVLLDKDINWDNWRFGHKDEYIYEDEYPYNLFKKNIEYMFYRLSELSKNYGVRIVLEHDAISKYLYKTELLTELLDQYNNLKICLDIARLHLLESIDKDFDRKKFVNQMAPYTYLVHLSNVKIDSNLTNNHYPALSHLNNEDGWADAREYLRDITRINKDIKILFEHRSDLISDDELEACYRWVDGVVNR